MLDSLSLLWRRFTPLEERLLSAVRSVLPSGAQLTYDAQVAAVTRVQRLPPTWSEVDFYCLRLGKVDWSLVPSFPCTDEFRLAEVRFRVAGTSYRTVLACIAGHVFDLATTPGPKSVAFTPWDSQPNVTLLGDPQRPPTGRKEPESPAPAWRSFLERHPGSPPRDWVLHDATTAYRVALSDAEYLVLAERAGEEFILQRLYPPADGLFRLQGSDGVPERLTRDLHQALGYDGA